VQSTLTTPRTWLLAAVLALGAVVVAATAALVADDGSDHPEPRPATASDLGLLERPNLIVVMTDDQTLAGFTPETMPKTFGYFERAGTIFDLAIAAPPLCCPSRAAFLSGRYAHNTGVVRNAGGYSTLRAKRKTFAVALDDAGYRTGMFGKFLNGYRRSAGAKPAPGFGRWLANHRPADYFDFKVSDEGTVKRISGYSTAYFTRKAIEFARNADEHGDPFFFWLSYNAPHTVAAHYPTPCRGEAAQPSSRAVFERFADAPLPHPPSFNESDVSDKPALAEGHPRLTPREIREVTLQWRCNLAASRDVDEGMARLVAFLRESDELSRTVLVYVSDNGYYFGEHRLHADKRLPLEPALRVPLAISVGEKVGPSAPSRIGELVSQVDIAPTLLDYAGVKPCRGGRPCRPIDGRSLRGLLQGRARNWPDDRAVPMELADGWTYAAIRTPHELYMEVTAAGRRDFTPPAVEMYDLEADPDQLENLAGSTDPAVKRRVGDLGARLDRLHRCVGIEGRDAPRGTPFCE